jgi:hypothetical protein
MTLEHVLAQHVGISVGDSGAHVVGFIGANLVIGTLVSWALGWGVPLSDGIVLLAIGLSLMIVGARSLTPALAKPRG